MEKIYRRELLRLENSIKSLISEKKLIINLHYPPINTDGSLNDFFNIARDYKAHTVIYGHLHGNGHRLIKEGKFEGVNLVCVASDYVNFAPVRIG